MAVKLLQMDFPVDGPWGEDMTEAYKELAESIAKEPGFISKIWTENKETGEAGGIYLFEDEDSLNKYLNMHKERLQSFGVRDIQAKVFDVNEPLTAITNGKID